MFSLVAALSILPVMSPLAGQDGSAVPSSKNPPKSGPAPRMPDGKPDLSGVWDHPFVIDMAWKKLVGFDGKPTDNCGAQMKGCSDEGPGELPMTPLGAELFKNYDPANFDPTGHCNPMGYTRSINAPVPTEIIQTPKEIVFLHESMFAFHVIYMDGRRHPTADESRQTNWYGHSTGRWDGDTLVVDTVGPFFGSPKQLLDTRGHAMSDELHVVERFRRTDANHMAYEVTIDDPKMFTKPWKNVRTWVLMPADEEIMEYVCTENNKEVNEHHIK